MASNIHMNSLFQGPEIFSKYVGQSEKSIRNIFQRYFQFNSTGVGLDRSTFRINLIIDLKTYYHIR